MAIKASAQITLTSVVDVKATYRYYLLQGSTLAKPSKPTTFPPTTQSSGGDTLTWDGNTDGLENSDGVIYKISDVTPTIEDLANGGSYIVLSLSIEPIVFTVGDVIVDEGMLVLANNDGIPIVIFVPEDINDPEIGIISKGTYFSKIPINDTTFMQTSSLTINGYTGFGGGNPAWDDSEPTYTEGSTNSLYTVDCTVFSNDTFVYSEVSLSSSYEAAKAAYNKADNAMKHTVLQSTTAPTITTYMWLDISIEPPALKRYNPTTQVWEIINDTTAINESIILLEEHTYSEIAKTEEAILTTVAEQYYLQTDAEKLASSMSTQIEQTASDLTIRFDQFNTDLESLSAGTDAEFEQIRKYIRFVNGKILLGEVGKELELQIANDRISFQQNGAEVAYFSNNKLYVVDGEFTNSLRLGNFAFIPRANGNLSFKKV